MSDARRAMPSESSAWPSATRAAETRVVISSASIARRARPFSCEAASEDGPDLVLQATGRYAHRRSHVEALCQAAGVDVTIEDTVLRHENHAPVHGFVVVAHQGA